VRDDRGADVQVGAKAANVIEMLVCIHQEANRLVRKQARHLLDDGQASFFVERRFDDDDIVSEFDRDAVV
jgi:hypothetical protein